MWDKVNGAKMISKINSLEFPIKVNFCVSSTDPSPRFLFFPSQLHHFTTPFQSVHHCEFLSPFKNSSFFALSSANGYCPFFARVYVHGPPFRAGVLSFFPIDPYFLLFSLKRKNKGEFLRATFPGSTFGSFLPLSFDLPVSFAPLQVAVSLPLFLSTIKAFFGK